jgi:NADPH-dependent ferric siderophore reductase
MRGAAAPPAPPHQHPMGDTMSFERESVRHTLARRDLTVDRVTTLTPTMVRVTLVGANGELDDFASEGPADHVKVFFPDPATGTVAVPEVTPEGARAPSTGAVISRDYTPRAFRGATADVPAELDIDFVVHGTEGPASAWAASAKPGDALVVAGPRGSRLAPTGIRRAVLIADETALPAFSRWLELLEPDVEVTAFLDVADSSVTAYLSDEQRRRASIVWLYRENGADQLLAGVRGLGPIDDETFVFAGGEAGSLAPVRRYLRRELGLPAAQVAMSGYWRRGTAGLDHHAPIDPTDPD